MPPTKRYGKGTKVYVAPATNDAGDPPIIDNVITSAPGVVDLTAFTNYGCSFNVQPAGCSWSTVTGERCLDDADVPTVELEDPEEDNPGFAPPFDPGDSEYRDLEDWCSTNQCVIVYFLFPGGGEQFFTARIKSMPPDSVERNTYMRTPITLLRTSGIYRDVDVFETALQTFPYDTCREPES